MTKHILGREIVNEYNPKYNGDEVYLIEGPSYLYRDSRIENKSKELVLEAENGR